MELTAIPLVYANINDFSSAAALYLQQGNGGTYYVQLASRKTPTSPAIRYVPTVGSTVQLTFPRALSIAPTPANQDVVVTLSSVDSRDTSIFQFSLSAAQVDKIVSGGAKVAVTESGVTKTYPVDNFVIRRTSAPGA